MQAKSTQSVICRFYAKGYCKNGWACAFIHETARRNEIEDSSDSDVTVETDLCRYFAKGKCLKGNRCNFRHDKNPSAHKELDQGLALPPSELFDDIQSSNNTNHLNSTSTQKLNAESSINENKLHLEHSTQLELECSICLESVLKQGKQFGLLPRCDHVFCLDCIRSWRQPNNSIETNIQQHHVCPICRVKSFYVVPSALHESGENKKRIIYEYRQRLKSIPCKYYKMGRTSCPFADRCFYNHGNIHKQQSGPRSVVLLPNSNVNTLHRAPNKEEEKDRMGHGHATRIHWRGKSKFERITTLARAIQYARALLRGNAAQYAEYEEDYQRAQQNSELNLELAAIIAKDRKEAREDSSREEKSEAEGQGVADVEEKRVSDAERQRSGNVDETAADIEYRYETAWD